MSLPFDAITLLVEDIREEAQGTVTLVGVLTDKLTVPSFPGALPKLAFYFRAHVPIDVELRDLSLTLSMLDGTEMPAVRFEEELLLSTRADALNDGKPYYGLFGHAIVSPFGVPGPGVVKAIVRSGGKEQVTGSLIVQGPQ